jgi:hypothetical protein
MKVCTQSTPRDFSVHQPRYADAMSDERWNPHYQPIARPTRPPERVLFQLSA